MGLKIKNIPPVIVACAVLHNIALSRDDALIEEDTLPLVEDEPLAPSIGVTSNQNFVVRTILINTHFSN